MTAERIARARCLLFAPATRPDRCAKALGSGADGVIVDLEDAVPLAAKRAARGATVDFLRATGGTRPGLVVVRINALRTRAGEDDVVALVEAGVRPDALLLPKVEEPLDVQRLAASLTGALAGVAVLALIETAVGLEQAAAIAAAGHGLAGLCFGGADLAADLGAKLAWEPMLFARSRLVQAAATRALPVFDVPWLDVPDLAGLDAECRRARALGFTGKLAIHPSHVPGIVAAFTPDAAEVARAHRLVAAYDAAAGGVCEVDGRMVDAPVYRAARRTLARAGTA